MRKQLIFYLFFISTVQADYVGNGGWWRISGMEGVTGISGCRWSGGNFSIGIGARRKYEPGIGIDIGGFGMVVPKWDFKHLGMDAYFVISPYLRFFLPLSDIKKRKNEYYYPLVFHAFAGGWGVFDKSEGKGYSIGCGIDYAFIPEEGPFSIGIETGIMGVPCHNLSSPYWGITFKLLSIWGVWKAHEVKYH